MLVVVVVGKCFTMKEKVLHIYVESEFHWVLLLQDWSRCESVLTLTSLILVRDAMLPGLEHS